MKHTIAIIALASLVGAQDPTPTDEPAPQPAPEPRKCDGLDEWMWLHRSPTPSPKEQVWTVERQERDDREAAAQRASRPHPACLGTETTPLTVTIEDDYVWPEDCEAAPAHALDVVLDGSVVASVVVPCSEGIQFPPRAYEAPSFDVPPGVHRIRIRERIAGVSAVRDYVFPTMLGDDRLATHVRVWASERVFQVDDLEGPSSLL